MNSLSYEPKMNGFILDPEGDVFPATVLTASEEDEICYYLAVDYGHFGPKRRPQVLPFSKIVGATWENVYDIWNDGTKLYTMKEEPESDFEYEVYHGSQFYSEIPEGPESDWDQVTIVFKREDIFGVVKDYLDWMRWNLRVWWVRSKICRMWDRLQVDRETRELWDLMAQRCDESESGWDEDEEVKTA